MSTTRRDILQTVPLYEGGAEMPCRLPRWTGGCRTDGRYAAGRRVAIAHPYGGLHLPVSINARTALERLTSIQEVSMPTKYDYDDHIKAVAGTMPIGKPLPERDDRWPLWLSVPAIIGVSIVLWSIVIVAGVGLRALWEALS